MQSVSNRLSQWMNGRPPQATAAPQAPHTPQAAIDCAAPRPSLAQQRLQALLANDASAQTGRSSRAATPVASGSRPSWFPSWGGTASLSLGLRQPASTSDDDEGCQVSRFDALIRSGAPTESPLKSARVRRPMTYRPVRPEVTGSGALVDRQRMHAAPIASTIVAAVTNYQRGGPSTALWAELLSCRSQLMQGLALDAQTLHTLEHALAIMQVMVQRQRPGLAADVIRLMQNLMDPSH